MPATVDDARCGLAVLVDAAAMGMLTAVTATMSSACSHTGTGPR
jgi:hypothetical protein